MSMLISGGKKVDKYYAKQLLKEFCQVLDSGKYTDKVVIDSAVNALKKISEEDREFAKILIEVLQKKYRDTKEFQQVTL